MIGLFINTIPIRIKTHQDETFHELLIRCQKEMLEAEPFTCQPLFDIQANTALKQELIDHIIVFENYPLQQKIADSADQTIHRCKSIKFKYPSNQDITLILSLLLAKSLSSSSAIMHSFTMLPGSAVSRGNLRKRLAQLHSTSYANC